MPIRINLMAEAQVAEEMRRRDPVKRAIWIGGFVVMLVLLWIAKVQLDIMHENKQLAILNAEWATNLDQHGLTMKDRYGAVTTNQLRIGEIKRKLEALANLTTNRFLWGNVLNALQQTVSDQVQVTRVITDQLIEPVEAQPINKTNTIPGYVKEKITLTLDAKDFKPDAQSYLTYKDKLSDFEYFRKLLGRRDGFIMGAMISPLTPDPMDSNIVFKSFTLVSHLPEIKHLEPK